MSEHSDPQDALNVMLMPDISPKVQGTIEKIIGALNSSSQRYEPVPGKDTEIFTVSSVEAFERVGDSDEYDRIVRFYLHVFELIPAEGGGYRVERRGDPRRLHKSVIGRYMKAGAPSSGSVIHGQILSMDHEFSPCVLIPVASRDNMSAGTTKDQPIEYRAGDVITFSAQSM